MFSKIVESFLNIKNQNQINEFEIRFGSFIQSKYFDCNVDISFFYRLKKMLKIQNNNKNHAYKFFVDTYYKQPNNEILREMILYSNLDKTEVLKKDIISKRSIKYHNEFDYDIRFSVASETIVKTQIKKDIKTMIREKERDTFYFSCGKIDLTKVYEHNLENNTKKVKYEIEFEITQNQVGGDKGGNNQEGSKNLIKEICNIIRYIIQIRQDNFYIISNAEINTVLNQYKNMTKSSFFIGAQPETLQKDNLSLFYNEPYSVTQKADGERCFLFINESKDMYFVDSNLKITKTHGKSDKYVNVVIDGELLKVDNKIHFMAFDLLIFNNIDLRGQQEFNLIKRIDILKTILPDVNFVCNSYHLSCKKYIFKNVFLGSEILLDNKFLLGNDILNNEIQLNVPVDGLIFTPINEAYSQTKKWIKLLKWKPKELNTIDFLSVKKECIEGNTFVWELYIQTVNEQKKMESELFDVNALNTKFNFTFHTNTELVTFKTEFDDSFIDPTTTEPFKSNTVIEYRWDYNLKRFLPLKTRWDKTLNPYKQGNFGTVACSIWNNITNPIEKDILFKLRNLNIKDDIYFKNMRRFHNKIKEGLYNKYTKNTDSLLELCVGKGGDMHKWLYNNVKYICGYDISEKNLNECNERFKSVQKNNNINIINADFYKLDLRVDNSKHIISKHLDNHPSIKKYTTISCQFAIHYFFESKNIFDNLIDILDNCLDDNGTFMITYMDSSLVNQLFASSKPKNKESEGTSIEMVYKEDNGNIVYLLKKTQQPNNNAFGNKLKIFLDGNNILNETSDEYLVDSKFLISYMNERGYTCIENDYFTNNNNHKNFSLNTFEEQISSLNMYSVFRKTNLSSKSHFHKKEIDIDYTTNKNINVYKEDTHTFKDEHSNKVVEVDDLTLLSVNDSYQIFDLLNCNQYSINKHNYTNIQINTINDMNKVVRDLNRNTKNILANDMVRNQYNIVHLNNDENNKTSINIPKNNDKDTIYKKVKNLYVYKYDYTTIVSAPDPSDPTNMIETEKHNTLWYIVLYKYNIFYDNVNEKIFAKLNIFNINPLEPTKKTQIELILETTIEQVIETTPEIQPIPEIQQ